MLMEAALKAEEEKGAELQLQPASPPKAIPPEEAEIPNRKLHLGAPSGSMNFEDAKHAFLYPYKVEHATKNAARPARVEVGRVEDDFEVEEARRYKSRDFHRYEQYTEEEVRQELQTILNLHTKDIITLQAEFVRNFPFEQIKTRVSQVRLPYHVRTCPCLYFCR